MDLFGNTAAILNSFVSNSYYGMFRGQIQRDCLRLIFLYFVSTTSPAHWLFFCGLITETSVRCLLVVQVFLEPGQTKLTLQFSFYFNMVFKN